MIDTFFSRERRHLAERIKCVTYAADVTFNTVQSHLLEICGIYGCVAGTLNMPQRRRYSQILKVALYFF